MIPWLDGIIPHLKVLHIAALALWCGGLFALPLMLARHDPAIGQADYARIRQATHYGYTLLVTPSAVIAIASGTLLIFLRDVFVAWMFAKLVVVALLVAFHGWVGHTLVTVAETEGAHQTPAPLGPTLILLAPVLAILLLVLAKPELGEIPVPGWLREPRGAQLPFDVPRR
ncbi:CopD family protein [Rubellimicrobium arenae]|uniref:CopD family protein n=1 Tax=Rubellimicrobium arenae TaxID=2817372 RepID=UPI001B30889A|nr:CopD family protein [Rubellimicrobium arenae]